MQGPLFTITKAAEPSSVLGTLRVTEGHDGSKITTLRLRYPKALDKASAKNFDDMLSYFRLQGFEVRMEEDSSGHWLATPRG